ncbi:MAG: HAMP domain-containing protein [Caldilineaceae bacterium]|nr:HAMP domain-containing protein [Caldilineaceae bacterium]
MRQLTDVAERITGGELGARIISYSSGEIGQLARAFNRMASNLENLLRKSEQETDRLNTVMYAMNDGVLIVNKLGKVELINRGATRLLNTAEANAPTSRSSRWCARPSHRRGVAAQQDERRPGIRHRRGQQQSLAPDCGDAAAARRGPEATWSSCTT